MGPTETARRFIDAFSAADFEGDALAPVRAARGDKILHNFAAHLLEVADGKITQWWMADAKPAESDAFWS